MAVAPPTCSEILVHYGLSSEQLDVPCSPQDIIKVSGFLVSWRVIAPHLGLEEEEVEVIEEDGKDASDRKRKAVQKWKSKYGYKATYKCLVDALLKVHLTECAEKVCQLVKAQHECSQEVLQTSVSILCKRCTEAAQQAIQGANPSVQPFKPRIPSTSCDVLENMTIRQMYNLTSDFAQMYAKVVSILAEAVSPDTLKRYLDMCRHPSSKQPYVDSQLYSNCASTDEIIDTLEKQHYFHPTQVGLLGKIVMAFGDVDGDHECRHVKLFKEYKRKIVKDVALSRRQDLPSDVKIDPSACVTMIKVTVEGDYENFTLLDVEKIQGGLEELTKIDRDVMILVDCQPGSVILTFLVPKNTTDYLLEISQTMDKIRNIEIGGTDTFVRLQEKIEPSYVNIEPNRLAIATLHSNKTAMEEECIAEVMEEKGVMVHEIPMETPFRPTPSGLFAVLDSRRYFECRALAMFRAHDHVTGRGLCSRSWESARAWCIIDLKEQLIIYRFTQDCQACEGTVEPDYEEDSVRRMAEYAVKTFLRRSGRGERRDPFNFSAMGDALDRVTDGPHDAGRCQRCRMCMGLPCQQ